MNRKLPNLLIRCLFLMLAALLPVFVMAQAEEAQTADIQTPAQTPALRTAGVQTDYRIQVGDEIEIKSFYNPEINDKVMVRPDGRISLQLANDVPAAGRTPTELAQVLTQQYSSQFRQPEVSVILRTFAGQRVYVGGEVNRPQVLNLLGPMTALQAIAAAEGFRDTARLSEIILIRRGPDLRPQASILNLKEAMKGNDLAQDAYLQPFDIVYVPKSRAANVNKFIDQIIRKNIPIPFSLSYRLNDPVAGGE